MRHGLHSGVSRRVRRSGSIGQARFAARSKRSRQGDQRKRSFKGSHLPPQAVTTLPAIRCLHVGHSTRCFRPQYGSEVAWAKPSIHLIGGSKSVMAVDDSSVFRSTIRPSNYAVVKPAASAGGAVSRPGGSKRCSPAQISIVISASETGKRARIAGFTVLV